MPSMTKRVNVYAQVAVRTITPPIYGNCKDIVMTTGDILKCLCKRARVEEILPDGSIVRLNLRNYYLDNGAGLDATKNIVKEEKKVPEAKPARFKVPVAPQAQVVETNKTHINEEHTVETVCEPVNDSTDDIASEINAVEIVSVTATTDITINAEEDIEKVGTVTTGYLEVLPEDNAGGIVGVANDNINIENCANTTAANNTSNNNHSSKKNKKK